MDHTGLADDLPSELTPGPSEEGVVLSLVCEHRGNVRPSGLPADEKSLGEIRFEKEGVLNDLKNAKNDEERMRDEMPSAMSLPI